MNSIEIWFRKKGTKLLFYFCMKNKCDTLTAKNYQRIHARHSFDRPNSLFSLRTNYWDSHFTEKIVQSRNSRMIIIGVNFFAIKSPFLQKDRDASTSARETMKWQQSFYLLILLFCMETKTVEETHSTNTLRLIFRHLNVDVCRFENLLRVFYVHHHHRQ